MVRAAVESVYIGLGSNLANRHENIVLALLLLERYSGIRISTCSSAYLTAPVSDHPQPTFVNAVVDVETSYTPSDLLVRLKEIESALGRVSRRRGAPGTRGDVGGPRPIDLDILMFGSRVVREPGLVIPHPRMQERHFVLYHLSEIAPEERHPVLGMSVAEMKRDLPRTACPPRLVEWGRIPRWSTVSTGTSSSRA